jgi:ribosome-associated translation inhibitor RaiA
MTEMQDRLRIVPEFRPDEYDRVRGLVFGNLARRLERWEPEQVELELSVKERDKSSQRTVLECWLHGAPSKLVATSTEVDLDRAVMEVRDDLRRQINRMVDKWDRSRTR